jgi:hypothetical protein
MQHSGGFHPPPLESVKVSFAYARLAHCLYRRRASPECHSIL